MYLFLSGLILLNSCEIKNSFEREIESSNCLGHSYSQTLVLYIKILEPKV